MAAQNWTPDTPILTLSGCEHCGARPGCAHSTGCNLRLQIIAGLGEQAEARASNPNVFKDGSKAFARAVDAEMAKHPRPFADYLGDEFAEAHMDKAAWERVFDRHLLACHEAGGDPLEQASEACIAASQAASGQLPEVKPGQSIVFADEPMPQGARIVASGKCGEREAVIVEIPPTRPRYERMRPDN